jgi:hypothetical protein
MTLESSWVAWFWRASVYSESKKGSSIGLLGSERHGDVLDCNWITWIRMSMFWWEKLCPIF